MKKMVVLAIAMLLLAPSVVLGQDDYSCTVEETAPCVERAHDGARINLTVTNDSGEERTFKVGVSAIGPTGVVYNWVYIYDAIDVAPGGSKHWGPFGPNPPFDEPPGVYTWHVFIQEDNGGIYHKCQCDFELKDSCP